MKLRNISLVSAALVATAVFLPWVTFVYVFVGSGSVNVSSSYGLFMLPLVAGAAIASYFSKTTVSLIFWAVLALIVSLGFVDMFSRVADMNAIAEGRGFAQVGVGAWLAALASLVGLGVTGGALGMDLLPTKEV